MSPREEVRIGSFSIDFFKKIIDSGQSYRDAHLSSSIRYHAQQSRSIRDQSQRSRSISYHAQQSRSIRDHAQSSKNSKPLSSSACEPLSL